MDCEKTTEMLSRRKFLGAASAAVTIAGGLPLIGAAQQAQDMSREAHTGANEQQPGPKNAALDKAEPDSVFPPETDAGGQPPFKYPFSFSHKRIEAGGWTRQVTVRDFPLSKKMAGVEMRLDPGRHPRVALARGRGVGHHDRGQRAHHRCRPEGSRVC